MSKLLNQYNELKKKDSNIIYIFRVGIFYNILNEDARIINKAIGLKLTDLGPNLIKCGFPVSNLEKYTKLLNAKGIKYQVISTPASSNNIPNTSYNSIINYIKNIDLDNTSCKQAFDTLYNIQQKIKNIQ